MVKDATLVRALEKVATTLGVEVRWERGAFQGGRCTLGGQDIIILNRRLPTETHLRVLALAIDPAALDSVPMRPAIRNAARQLIEKMSA